MHIAIVDADLLAARRSKRFPNLACMKLSAYHKQCGDLVTLARSWDGLEDFDRVFVSKVFEDTHVPPQIVASPNTTLGGTGFFYDRAPALPPEVEHIMPDYGLYDDYVAQALQNGASPASLRMFQDYSVGYTTRGCVWGCSNCVNKNYTACTLHSPVEEFLHPQRPYICCLDDNVFACREWKSVFQSLNDSGKRFQFRQGLDVRLLDDEKAETLFSSRWIGDYIFAFDNIADRRIVERGLQTIRRHTQKIPKFYVFCAYDRAKADRSTPAEFWKQDISDTFERIHVLMSYKALPYIMRYKDYAASPHHGIYITLARWCNQPGFAKKKSFREFCAMRPDSARYADQFASQYPDIARDCFDIRWPD